MLRFLFAPFQNAMRDLDSAVSSVSAVSSFPVANSCAMCRSRSWISGNVGRSSGELSKQS